MPSDAEVLGLWERGLARHPIDRTLAVGAWARPDLEPSTLGRLPLGALNTALLGLRAAWFGPDLEIYSDCPSCGERVTTLLSVHRLLEGAPAGDGRELLEVGGYRFRAPDSLDVASIVAEPDTDSAVLALLDRCCVGRPEDATCSIEDLLEEVERALEALDPAASFELLLECPACEQAWGSTLSVAELVWDELAVAAGRLLEEVHVLARAYGWSESEILRLPRGRRSAYMALVSG